MFNVEGFFYFVLIIAFLVILVAFPLVAIGVIFVGLFLMMCFG